MARPDVAVMVWTGVAFVDWGTKCTAMTISNGKQKVLDRMTGASCSFTIDALSSGTDPSTVFTVGTFLYVEAENSAAVDVTLFAGRVASVATIFPGPDHAIVQVTCEGAHAQFSAAGSGTFTVTDDVEDVLDGLVADAFGGTPDGTYVVYTDPFGGKCGDTAVLSAASGTPQSIGQAVVDGTLGDLVDWFSNDRTHPVFQYVGRRRRFQNPAIVFSDDDAEIDPTVDVYPYDTTAWVSAPTNDLIRNQVTVTRSGGAAQSVEDTTSSDITDGHGPRPHSLSSYHASDAEALTCAKRILWENTSPPAVAVSSIRLQPDAEFGGESDELWDLVLDVGIEYISSDRLPLMRQVTVKRTGPFGVIERNCILTGYRHEIRPLAAGGWTTTLFFADGHLYTGGDMTAFTAVVKQNGATVAHTSRDAYYFVTGDECSGHWFGEITAAGTANTEIKVTPTGIPAPANSYAGTTVGTFEYFDNGTSLYHGSVDWDGTDFRFSQTNSGGYRFGITPNFALANTDNFKFWFKFRVA